MVQRDQTIDRLRGFAMLWVIVVHVLYWGSFFANEWINLLKSFCLFEMPLFFFLTGASSSFSKDEGYFHFVSKRFLRMLIPYWVFALICAGLSIWKYSMEVSVGFLSGVKIVVSWLVPINEQITSIPYLTYALWFVPVYLCVALIIPLLKWMKRSDKRIWFAALIMVVFAITCVIGMKVVQNVVFYSLWTYIGLFYPEIKASMEKKQTRKHFWFVAIVGIAGMCAMYFLGQPIDMQFNKFPPNVMFMLFSFVMMVLIGVVYPYVDGAFAWLEKGRVTGKIFRLYSMRSMTIFLYQVYAFNLTIPLSRMLIPGYGIAASAAKALLCLVMSILACGGLAVVLGWIEKISGKIPLNSILKAVIPGKRKSNQNV